MGLTYFLPCRRGSERVPAKNTRSFAGVDGGLVAIKLRQLLDTASLTRLVLSTDDPEIQGFARSLGDPRLEVVERPAALAASSTSTDELIAHVPELIAEGDVLWTHVTSPFVTAADYDRIAATYRRAREDGYDSLMTVTPLKAFLWNEDGPVNYDRAVERWPRTQTLSPLYEVNSAAFVCPRSTYVATGDRIGRRPYLYELDPIRGFDIDWQEDFTVAEALLASGRAAT